MTDCLSPEQRHRCMSHIRSRNTKPERKVRQWLWNHGFHVEEDLPIAAEEPEGYNG